MSQQTQVPRAAAYFKRWIAKWPTVQVGLCQHGSLHADLMNLTNLFICQARRPGQGTSSWDSCNSQKTM